MFILGKTVKENYLRREEKVFNVQTNPSHQTGTQKREKTREKIISFI